MCSSDLRPEARGVIWGLTRGTTAGHLARATLEGIAFQNDDVLTAMQKDLGRPLKSLKVDGGAAANALLMQIQADLLGVDIVRPAMLQTTALGAALLAGLGIGWFSDLAAIRAAWQAEQTFTRQLDAAAVAAWAEGWQAAVARA